MRKRIYRIAVIALLVAVAPPVFAAEGSHGDPVAPVLLALMVISVLAAFGRRWMQRVGQPAVLGELLIGMLVGNIGYFVQQPTITVLREGSSMNAAIERALQENISVANVVRQQMPDNEHTRQLASVLESPNASAIITSFQFIDVLSRVAVIVLLFLAGLETSVGEMKRVGLSATLVAVVGVFVPFLLGMGVVRLILPDAPLQKDVFIGAILTATSVGITARVFRDLNQSHRDEAKVILGAAVIDDVLGLIILAVVSGLVVTGTISVAAISKISLKAVVFLAGSIGIGVWITPRLVHRLAQTEMENIKLLFGLGFAFALAWLANVFGLAPIVGAFAAGLVLEELFLKEMRGDALHELISPIESLIVPVFFVLMGLQVKLEAFSDWKVILIAAALIVAGILGKVVAGLACSKKLDRLSVGIGMMPRGEVGLIFAGIGRGLGVVDDSIFSAVVIMVMVTTLLTPPLLKITLARSEKAASVSV